jgi:hypothetical protein
VRESLAREVLYLFLYAFILFVVNRNAILDYLFLLLNQVCMCDQWLVLDLMSLVYFVEQNGEAIVGLVLKLNWKTTLHTSRPCVCVVKLANKFITNPAGHTPRVLMQGRKKSRRRTPTRIPLYSY